MAIILFNFVDTIFVGRLGTKHLAAMSFTFPVVFTIQSLALGLSVGTTSVISRAIGAGDHEDVRRLTTHALVLSVSLVTILALTGLFTIDPLFTLLGATPEILPLIRQYMVPWYFGVGFVVVPMVGNGAIRATGDTKTPSYVMMVAGLANVILDPLLIFGIGPFPRMELQGAAIATVIARALTFIAAIWVLRYREKILEFTVHGMAVILDSWKRILHIGILILLRPMLR